MDKDRIYLSIYLDRSELHDADKMSVFYEGPQSEEASERFKLISDALKNGFYDDLILNSDITNEVKSLTDEQSNIIKALVNEITSEVGRALVGLTCLQLAIKTICPQQSIRLHKGSKTKKKFSWREGLSMRVLDKKYNTPFLRKHNLLKLNNDGVMMTRSLAENYPYSKLYKAEIRGPIDEWKTIVENIEDGSLPPKQSLCLLLSLLKNHSEQFSSFASYVVELSYKYNGNFDNTLSILNKFVNETQYSSRAFEVVLHSFMQAYDEIGFIDGDLVPLSQMRSANKKHGNIGDVEIKVGDYIIESWDAKYGKSNLRDELEELADKLTSHPGVDIAGFISNGDLEMTDDIISRIDELTKIFDCEIILTTFNEWVKKKISVIDIDQLDSFGKQWLLAVVESFGQRRPQIAQIDEPCDKWLYDLSNLLVQMN